MTAFLLKTHSKESLLPQEKPIDLGQTYGEVIAKVVSIYEEFIKELEKTPGETKKQENMWAQKSIELQGKIDRIKSGFKPEPDGNLPEWKRENGTRYLKFRVAKYTAQMISELFSEAIRFCEESPIEVANDLSLKVGFFDPNISKERKQLAAKIRALLINLRSTKDYLQSLIKKMDEARSLAGKTLDEVAKYIEWLNPQEPLSQEEPVRNPTGNDPEDFETIENSPELQTEETTGDGFSECGNVPFSIPKGPNGSPSTLGSLREAALKVWNGIKTAAQPDSLKTFTETVTDLAGLQKVYLDRMLSEKEEEALKKEILEKIQMISPPEGLNSNGNESIPPDTKSAEGTPTSSKKKGKKGAAPDLAIASANPSKEPTKTPSELEALQKTNEQMDQLISLVNQWKFIRLSDI